MLETGERAGWAGIGFLLINPTSRSLGPNWGSVSVVREGGRGPLLPAVGSGSCLDASAAQSFALEAWGIFSGLVFLGTDGMLWWPPPQEDFAFSACSKRAPGAQGQARAGDSGLRRGDRGPAISPHRRPRGWSHRPFLYALSRFYRQRLVWDINCLGEFDNFDVTEHWRNYPHVQNVKFEKNQVQRLTTPRRGETVVGPELAAPTM